MAAPTLPFARDAGGQAVPATPVFELDVSGNPIGPASQFFVGTTTPLAGSATYAGPTRDVGVASGAAHGLAYFNGFFLADQIGTAYLDGSADGTTWYVEATAALAVNTPLILSVPIIARYHRTRVVNGATGQGSLVVNSSFTAA